jgi:hypothetical protein
VYQQIANEEEQSSAKRVEEAKGERRTNPVVNEERGAGEANKPHNTTSNKRNETNECIRPAERKNKKGWTKGRAEGEEGDQAADI